MAAFLGGRYQPFKKQPATESLRFLDAIPRVKGKFEHELQFSFIQDSIGWVPVRILEWSWTENLGVQFIVFCQRTCTTEDQNFDFGFQKPHFGNTVWPCGVQQIISHVYEPCFLVGMNILPSCKLKWQWKIDHLKVRFLSEHGDISLPSSFTGG